MTIAAIRCDSMGVNDMPDNTITGLEGAFATRGGGELYLQPTVDKNIHSGWLKVRG